MDVPDFSGPYAAEFAETYRSASSDFVRSALEDEQISDAEFAEMTERFRQCLADEGIEFMGFDGDGYQTSLAPPHGGDTHEIVSGCATESGQDAIGMLRDIMTVNPEHRDIPAAMAECLVGEGVVSPPGYGADDYDADMAGRFADPANISQELKDALISCSRDPLGILGEK